MEISSLDLRDHRCPMGLLLAKRACAKLKAHESIQLLIQDQASLDDIYRYLLRTGFIVHREEQGETIILQVQK